MGEPAGTPASNRARETLQSKLGVSFQDPSLYEVALTHRSFAYENDVAETNERLEFLGDAILSLCVTDLLYKRFPDLLEGDLAKLRASLVSEPALAEIAAELGLGDAVMLGRGELLSGGTRKPSIMADALEAVLGAIYVDGGIQTIRKVVRTLFGSRVEDAAGKEIPKDAKTRLQELVTRRHGMLPRYRVTGFGPDHEKRFRAEVFVNERFGGRGEGRSKKEAEQAAAAHALEHFDETVAAKPSGPRAQEAEHA
jgi:ribonuclease-3